MKTAKKKHPPSPKLLAHLKRLNLARRKKAKKPAAARATKPAKPAAKAAARKPKKAPAAKPVVLTPIPPVELPKGDAPGQTTMPVVEAACGCGEPSAAPQPAAPASSGEELL